jgi:hypothetical protein
MVQTAFTAVQDDPASFAMDWPVIDQAGESGFRGSLFVLDEAGVRVGDAAMSGPGNLAADDALRRLGFTRAGEWGPDGFGRPAARVERRVTSDRNRIPVQPIASAAEESSLHIG